MKKILVLMLVMAAVLSPQAANSLGVQFERLNESYAANEIVVFEIKNDNRWPVDVYVNAEATSGDGEWTTWPFDIEDGQSETLERAHPIAKNGRIQMSFDVRKAVLPPLPTGAQVDVASRVKFRLRADVLKKGETDRRRGSVIYSKEFTIERPYDR